MKKLKVLGVCSGVGASIFTFHKRKNFEVIGSIEPRAVFHTRKEEQWKINFGDLPFERSITPKVRKLRPDIIVGHPDCGDSSVLRLSRAKKKGNVSKNSSVLLFFESIKHYHPITFLLENLPQMLNSCSLSWMNDILDQQYELIAIQGSVALWGNSQVSRNRLVLVGVNKDYKSNYLMSHKLIQHLHQFQARSQTLKPSNLKWQPAQAFELGPTENVSVGHYRELPTTFVSMYHPPTGRRKITFQDAEQLWSQLPSSSQRWPVGGKMQNQPGVSRHIYGKPPLTVRKQNRQFGVLGLVLSPREMANIQGFPSSFRLFVDLDQRVYWLNKNRVAVTKTCPYEIPKWFKKVIKQSIT